MFELMCVVGAVAVTAGVVLLGVAAAVIQAHTVEELKEARRQGWRR